MSIRFIAQSKEWGEKFELQSKTKYSEELINSIQNDTIDKSKKDLSFSNFLDCYFNDELRNPIIEDLIQKINTEYQDAVDEIKNSDSYKNASDLEKIEMEKIEIYGIVNKNRKIRSYFDEPVNLFIKPIDIQPMKDFIGYSEDEISFIASILDNKSSTFITQPDHYEYETIIQLENKELFLKGEEIDSEFLLEPFTVKELNQLFKSEMGRNFKNRKEAVEFALNVEDLKTRLASIKALSQIYYLDKKKFNVTDNKIFENSYNYLWEYYQKMSTLFDTPSSFLSDDERTEVQTLGARDEVHLEGSEVEILRSFFKAMSSKYEQILQQENKEELDEFLSIKHYIFE